MKKIVILICCSLLLLSLLGCGKSKEDFTTPVNFYYEKTDFSYNSECGVIEKEVREGAALQGNVTAFMHAYLRGPDINDLQSIIPSDVYLVSCLIENETAYLTFSSQFSRLTGMKLTTACSAVLLSLHDYIGIDTVSIQAKESKLDDKDMIVLSMEDVVRIDTVEIKE